MNAKNAMQMDQGGSAASSAEWRWWEKLSKRKQDFLRSFLKHPLRKSFDKLLFIPGIWRGLNIGVLDKVMALRCDEVGAYCCSALHNPCIRLTLPRK